MAISGKGKRWLFVQKICGLTIGQLESSRRYGYPRILKHRSQHWDMALHAATFTIGQNEQNRAQEHPVFHTGQNKTKLTVMKDVSSRRTRSKRSALQRKWRCVKIAHLAWHHQEIQLETHPG